MRVEPTDGEGGVAGTTVRMPRRMDALESLEQNVALYVLRAVLEGMAVRARVSRPSSLDDGESRLLASLLLRPLRESLVRELPATAAAYDTLAGALLARRPAPSGQREREHAVETCARWALSGTIETRTAPWLERGLSALAHSDPAVAVKQALPLVRRISGLPGGRDGSFDLRIPLAGQVLPLEVMAGLSTDCPPGGQTLPRGSERRAPAKDYLRRVTLPEERENENPLEHSFEKVHTAETYQGGRKALDGEDELSLHGDALDELDVREVVRTREAARSVYAMEASTGVEPPQTEETPREGEQVCFYDEWDGRKYRKDYCRLTVEVPLVARDSLAAVRDLALSKDKLRIRRLFESLEDARRARPRSPSGSEVDVDAVVERYAFVRAGYEGPDRLYVDRVRVEQDLATLILLDLSSSSDAWIDGRRVLDTARDAVITLSEVLTQLGASFAIGGFHSHTHSDCRYLVLKGFDERWHDVRGRLFAVEPTGYTRIGPALRHASAILETTRARRKALCLITDGKPTDYDAYEGRYGLTDVKKACDEAIMRGVRPFALAITDRKRPHLVEMFGAGGYEILTHPAQLADRLALAQARWRL